MMNIAVPFCARVRMKINNNSRLLLPTTPIDSAVTYKNIMYNTHVSMSVGQNNFQESVYIGRWTVDNAHYCTMPALTLF